MPNTTVATIADMMALNPTTYTVGSVITVTDPKRGGVFDVVDDGSVTDGAITFAFDAHKSTEQTYTGNTTQWASTIFLGYTDLLFEHINLYWDWNGSTGTMISTQKDHHGLSGAQSDVPATPVIEQKTGLLRITATSNYINGKIKVTYKYINNTLRLVRQRPENTWNLNWADSINITDAQALRGTRSTLDIARTEGYLNWMTRQGYFYAEETGNQAIIEIPDSFYIRGTIVVPEGIELRGTGADIDVPYESWKAKGMLRFLPAPDDDSTYNTFYYLHSSYTIKNQYERLGIVIPSIYGNHRPPVYDTNGNYVNTTAITKLPIKATYLVIDGNNTENSHYMAGGGNFRSGYNATVYNNGYFYSSSPNTVFYVILQDATHGCLFWHRETADPFQKFQMNYCHVLNAPSNGVGGSGDWTGSGNCVMGNSIRNHIVYTAPGTWGKLTLYGYSWEAHVVSYYAIYEELVIRDLVPNANGMSFYQVFDHRMSLDRPASVVLGQGVTINSLDIDLTNSPNISVVHIGRYDNLVVKNQTLTTYNSGTLSLFLDESVTTGGLNRVFEDWTIYEKGTCEVFWNFVRTSYASIKNIVTISDSTTPYVRALINTRNLQTKGYLGKILIDGYVEERQRPYLLENISGYSTNGDGTIIWLKNSTIDYVEDVETNVDGTVLNWQNDQQIVFIKNFADPIIGSQGSPININLTRSLNHPDYESVDLFNNMTITSSNTNVLQVSKSAPNIVLTPSGTEGSTTLSIVVSYLGKILSYDYNITTYNQDLQYLDSISTVDTYSLYKRATSFSTVIAQIRRISDNVTADLFFDGEEITLNSAVTNLSNSGSNTTLGVFAQSQAVYINRLYSQVNIGTYLTATGTPELLDSNGAFRAENGQKVIYVSNGSGFNLTSVDLTDRSLYFLAKRTVSNYQTGFFKTPNITTFYRGGFAVTGATSEYKYANLFLDTLHIMTASSLGTDLTLIGNNNSFTVETTANVNWSTINLFNFNTTGSYMTGSVGDFGIVSNLVVEELSKKLMINYVLPNLDPPDNSLTYSTTIVSPSIVGNQISSGLVFTSLSELAASPLYFSLGDNIEVTESEKGGSFIVVTKTVTADGKNIISGILYNFKRNLAQKEGSNIPLIAPDFKGQEYFNGTDIYKAVNNSTWAKITNIATTGDQYTLFGRVDPGVGALTSLTPEQSRTVIGQGLLDQKFLFSSGGSINTVNAISYNPTLDQISINTSGANSSLIVDNSAGTTVYVKGSAGQAPLVVERTATTTLNTFKEVATFNANTTGTPLDNYGASIRFTGIFRTSGLTNAFGELATIAAYWPTITSPNSESPDAEIKIGVRSNTAAGFVYPLLVKKETVQIQNAAGTPQFVFDNTGMYYGGAPSAATLAYRVRSAGNGINMGYRVGTYSLAVSSGEIAIGSSVGDSFVTAAAARSNMVMVGRQIFTGNTTDFTGNNVLALGTNIHSFNSTASPKWDTVYSIAIGSGLVFRHDQTILLGMTGADSSSANQLVIGSYTSGIGGASNAPINEWWMSPPGRGTQEVTIGAIDKAIIRGQTNNLVGNISVSNATLSILGARGQGTGIGGDVMIGVAKAGTAGATQNSWTRVFRVHAEGKVSISDNGLGIGGASSSAILHLESTTGGLYLKPMTSTQASAITPVEGLILTTTGTINTTFTSSGGWIYEDSVWKKLATPRKTTSISSASLLTSFTTPITQIAAAGSGKGIRVKSITVKTTSGTVNYDTNTTLEIKCGSAVITSVDLSALPVSGEFVAYNINSHAITSNTAITAQNLTGNPATGDKAIDVILEYEIF